MKTKYLIIGLLISALGLSSCANFLDQEPTGGYLTQNQFDEVQGTVEGQVLGLYSMMIAYGGDHNLFGQKSIDITTDLMSSDMAMTEEAYGWFVSEARITCSTTGASMNSYFWSYYYGLIRNCNLAIKNLQNEDIDNDAKYANLYAQALTMRGYCYFGLVNLYNRPTGTTENATLSALSVPVYTETTPEKTPQPRATVADVYLQIESDLTAAAEYFEKSTSVGRKSKIEMTWDIAKGLLAYAYLNKGEYENAYLTAKEVIDADNYTIIPADKLTTTGFVSVNDESWMWGSKTTIENTTSLATFWGHVDIHTYSYAFSGAKKVIDERLYLNRIPDTDLRKNWFDAANALVPDWKFYDLNRGTTATTVDRNWLNDIVFMRIEEMYLIAAEGAYRYGNQSECIRILSELLAERDETMAENLDSADLLDELHYNWRVEMWGEGRALQTFKRFNVPVTRGGNHFAYAGQEFVPSDYRFQFAIPYAETTTNPHIDGTSTY